MKNISVTKLSYIYVYRAYTFLQHFWRIFPYDVVIVKPYIVMYPEIMSPILYTPFPT